MERIFAGLIFIMFGITICPAGNMMIGVLPNFIGYYFLVSGFRRLESENEHFEKAKPVAVLMGIYTTVAYIANIFEGKALIRTPGMLMVNAFTLAGFLYILYKVVTGTEELQEKYHIKSSISIMKWQWGVIAAGKIIIYILSALEMVGHTKNKELAIIFSPLSGAMSILYYILITMITIISVSFVVEFNKRKDEITAK